jgi:4-hydroxybenzoate polyprenyltransferase
VPNAALEEPAARPAGRFADYVAIARPDHWVKHVFILPGIALAELLHRRSLDELAMSIFLGLVSAALLASANYVLNEWLDARFDRFHPTKSNRPAVARRLSPALVYLEYALLAVVGLGVGALVSRLFLLVGLLFLASGWVYNIPPVRSKDRVYLDVITEALNNPIRLTLGWAMVDSTTLPPSSLLIAYWMGGAFLMAVKRFAEYRTVSSTAGVENLILYRRSFAQYTENSLLISSVVYALMAAFFLAVFLIKYRIEYLLSIPLFVALFAVYLEVGLKPGSSAQAPEKLFKERRLVTIAVLLGVVLVVLTFVDIPVLERLTDPHFIELSLDP